MQSLISLTSKWSVLIQNQYSSLLSINNKESYVDKVAKVSLAYGLSLVIYKELKVKVLLFWCQAHDCGSIEALIKYSSSLL